MAIKNLQEVTKGEECTLKDLEKSISGEKVTKSAYFLVDLHLAR